MEKYHNTPEERVPTYVFIDTSKDLFDTLGELELVEENWIAKVEWPLTDEDVEYLKEILLNEWFRNIRELYVNPIDLSKDARDDLLLYERTYLDEFPELHFIDDDWNDLNETEIHFAKAAA